MNRRVVRTLAAAAICFVLLTGQSCVDLSFSDIITFHSARITVANNASEVVFVALYADDAYQVGNLGAGQTHTIKTHIDGTYNVVVAGSGSQLGNYKSSLDLLRTATHDMHRQRDGGDLDKAAAAETALERTRTAKQNLSSLFQPELTLASCSGTIKFPTELSANPQPIEIGATVTKQGDAWAASCPSSS